MKETEKKYLLAIVKSIQTIQDCLFEVARRLDELEKEKQVKEHRYNFGKFFQEHDKRRGTDFCKTFPELESFYRECLEIKL